MRKRLAAGVTLLILLTITATVFSPLAGAASKTRVALVLSGGLGDRSFLDSAHRGLVWAGERLGVETRYIEPSGPEEFEPSIRAMAMAGYDLVITVYFNMLDATNTVADQFPNTKFAIIDAVSDRPNVTSLTFQEHVGSYLVGVVAGKMTKANKIGFVGGQEQPLIRRFEKGFIEGVKAVNPDAQIISGYAGSFSDPGKGKELAMSQYKRGADIVYHAAGKTGEGVIEAAKETGKYVIGVDSDQCYIAPDNMLVSMMKMVDVAIFNTIESFVNDEYESGVVKVHGLEERAVGPCRLYPDILDLSEHKDFPGMNEAMELVEKYRQKIMNGEIVVPDAMQTDI
jgi:basic membrane protein A